MSDQVVVTKDEDRVRVITINRPEALNSMNNAVFGGIRDALAEAEADDQVAVTVQVKGVRSRQAKTSKKCRMAFPATTAQSICFPRC